jgi:hypothetical protein
MVEMQIYANPHTVGEVQKNKLPTRKYLDRYGTRNFGVFLTVKVLSKYYY